jgi:hypothetical protein
MEAVILIIDTIMISVAVIKVGITVMREEVFMSNPTL